MNSDSKKLNSNINTVTEGEIAKSNSRKRFKCRPVFPTKKVAASVLFFSSRHATYLTTTTFPSYFPFKFEENTSTNVTTDLKNTSSKSVWAAGGEEQQSKMPCNGSGEEDLSKKMVRVEGDDDSWTVDCLRRRLAAERVSSRVAKEDAELMGRRLIELESQLKLEIKARNRAEKMLKFATKKLESLNISAALGQSSSPASEGSVSSSTCSSSTQEPDESSSFQKEIRTSNTQEKIKNEADSLLSEDYRCENSATAAADAVNQEPCYKQSSSSADAASFHNNEDVSVEDVNEFKDSLSSRELTTDAFRQSSPGEEVEQKQDQMEYADNALAIVPVYMWPESKNKESQINNITDVLIALQRAKEHLQSSIGIRSSACSKSVRLSGMYRDVLLPD